MPRRGEESSPAPRRSPRAAVKASASPSPIIRGSRSQSNAKQTAPKTRVASPSPKRRATSRSTKAEKDETPKQAQSRASAATKKAADKNKSQTTLKTAAASSSSKSRSRSRQKNVEESEEVEEEEEEEEIEETKTSSHRSRSRTTKAPQVKKGRATSARGKKAQAKEESEEEEVEEPTKSKSEKKKPPPKQEPEQTEVVVGGRTTSRSRRATSRQSEESTAAKEVKEVSARPMRSRSRGQGKKAEDEPCVEVTAEDDASKIGTSGLTEDINEPSPQEGPLSKRTSPNKKGQVQGQKFEEPKDAVANSGSSVKKEDEPTKPHKRGNAEIEKSPESILSSKRRRKDEISESVPDAEPELKATQSGKQGDHFVAKKMTKEMLVPDRSRTETDMDIEVENAEKISPKTGPSQSVSVSSPTCRVTDVPKVQPGLLDTSKSSLESLHSVDLSKCPVKAASENIQLSKSPVKSSSADLLEGPKKAAGGADLPQSANKDSLQSTVKPQNKANLLESLAKASIEIDLSAKSSVTTDVSKDSIKLPIGIDVSKSPLKLPLAASPVKFPKAMDESKSPFKLHMTACPVKSPVDVLKSPVKPPVTVDKSPVKPPVTVDKSPVKPPVTVDKSPVKPPVTLDKSPIKPPVTLDKSPVKPPVTVDKSPVKPPVTVTLDKSPVKPPVTVTLDKSPVKPPVTVTLDKSPVKPPVTVTLDKSPVKPPVTVTLDKSPVKPPVTVTLDKSPVKPPVTVTLDKSPVKPPVTVTLDKSPVKPPVTLEKSPVKPLMTVTLDKSPVKPPVTVTLDKSPVKPSVSVTVDKNPIKPPVAISSVKSPVAMDVSESPIKSPIVAWKSSMKSPMTTDALKSPFKSTDVSKSPVDLTKCSKPVAEIVKSPVKSVLSSTASFSSAKVSDVPTVTTAPLAVPTLSVKPVPSANTLPKKDPLSSAPQTKPMAGSLSANTNTPISGMSAQSPMPLVASAKSPICRPVGSSPFKSFTPQTVAGMSPVNKGSNAEPTVTHLAVSTPKSPQSRSLVISGMGMSPSKPSYQPSEGLSPSVFQSARQTFVQSATRSPNTTLSPTRQPLVQSTNQSLTHQPVVQSSNHSPGQRSVAPSSNLSPTRQPVVQSTNLLSAQRPVESSASLAKIQSPIVHDPHLSPVPQLLSQSANLSPTKQPVEQSANTSLSPTVQGTNLSSMKSSSVPIPSLVKTPSTSIALVKPTVALTGSIPPTKPVSPLSPRIMQNKPGTLSSGCLGPSSEPSYKQSKSSLAPITGQMYPMKTSVNPTVGLPQSKLSISPTKLAGYSDKPTLTSPPKSATPLSSLSPAKPTITNEFVSKPTALSMSSGSPTKQVVQPPSVPIGQSGTPSSVSSKSHEMKISVFQSATVKPQVTHVAGGDSSKPLITHMTGVVPQKSPNTQFAVSKPMTSSLSPNKSQVAIDVDKSPPKPSSVQGYPMPGNPVVSKPASTGITSPKPKPHHESSGISTKPPQTWGTMSSPPKPQVTHLASVVTHSRPQVTHMSGVAPPKSQMGPGDTSSNPKPPVVHVIGSAVPKSTGFSPSVAVSPPPPPKTSLHSSASFHSTTPVSSTADGSSFSSRPQTKCPSVPGTEKSVPSSPGGAQSVSPLKYSSGATAISGPRQASQPDSSFGRPLSSNVSQPVTPLSNIQSSQSSHSQKLNVWPTKSPVTAGISNKSLQPPSTAGQTVDSKAQSSCILSKAPDSSISSTTPSVKSLFSTMVSKTPMESQSKVPTLSTPNLQATIPVISSTATVASNKPVGSSTTTLQPPSQSARTPSVPPALVTVGNVQQIGAAPLPSAMPQLADSSKASSSSDGIINGAGAKTSAGLQLQSSEVCKKRKWDSEQLGESHEAKKSRPSPEDMKSLIANGQKDSSSIHQAPKLPPSQTSNRSEIMDVDQSPSLKQDSNGNEVSLKDYVVVNKNEVPHKDSLEVRQSLPKMPLSNPTPTRCADVRSSETGSSSATFGFSSSVSGTVGSSAQSTGSSAQSTGSKDVLLNRVFKLNPASISSTITERSRQFSVVTYNILADCHFRRGGKTDRYPADEQPFIQLPARHKRLMDELRYVDADIVCLQEVEPEYYSKTLSPDMQRLGYEGFYKKRVHENYDEGETTFYKTSRFSDPENTAYSLKQLIDKDIQELSLSEDIKESVRKFLCRPDVLLVTRLRCKNTGKFITVGNVHVNWGEFKLPNMQCVQIARAIREVVNRAGNDLSPHVICGDFNSSPQTPGYQLASEGYLSDSMIHSLQSSKTMEMPDGTKSALIDHLWQGFQHTSSSLKSAYAVVQGGEPELTTMTTHTRTCLDYVFYSSSSLEAVGVLQVPGKQLVIDCHRIPNRIFPSDHLSLKAVLAFK